VGVVLCRDAATNGFRPLQQYNLARQNYTTVVSYYEQQVKSTPPCVRNTTWFKGINSSIASILKPPGGNDTSPGELAWELMTHCVGGQGVGYRMWGTCVHGFMHGHAQTCLQM
jgi:hypothetical protein